MCKYLNISFGILIFAESAVYQAQVFQIIGALASVSQQQCAPYILEIELVTKAVVFY